MTLSKSFLELPPQFYANENCGRRQVCLAEWQGLASEETGIAVAKLATLVEESPKELGPLIVQTEVCCAYDCYRRLSQYGQVERPDVTATITPVQMCNVD